MISKVIGSFRLLTTNENALFATPRLEQAHKMLLGTEEYAKSHTCSSLASLFNEWTRLLRHKIPEPKPSIGASLLRSFEMPPMSNTKSAS